MVAFCIYKYKELKCNSKIIINFWSLYWLLFILFTLLCKVDVSYFLIYNLMY